MGFLFPFRLIPPGDGQLYGLFDQIFRDLLTGTSEAGDIASPDVLHPLHLPLTQGLLDDLDDIVYPVPADRILSARESMYSGGRSAISKESLSPISVSREMTGFP